PVDDVRRAYAAAGITVDQPTAYGTYYRLRCTACGANVGNIGDRLLPGMAEALVAGQADLYAAGLLGCACGHQRVTAAARGARAADGNGGTVTTPSRPSGDSWPFWRRVYAAGDPLPRFTRATAPAQRFDAGDAPPPGAFHARDWRDSSYAPLAEMSSTVERDELGHSEMGYRFLGEIVSDARGRALAQRLLAKWYPAALDMFGRSDSKNAPKFIGWGLK